MSSVVAAALSGQTKTNRAEVIDALVRSAEIFSRSAPGLTATETLRQKGRRLTRVVKKPRRPRGSALDDVEFSLGKIFETHEVVSRYSLTVASDEIADGSVALHENRDVVMIDGSPAGAGGVPRHALTFGVTLPQAAEKVRLENLELGMLDGAVTDLGPLLLLFRRIHLSDYSFLFAKPRVLDGEPVLILKYRQLAGTAGFVEFRDLSAERYPLEGTIWIRERDLLPLRITISNGETLSDRDTIRNEAEVNYLPSPFGFVPARVSHRQFLNDELLVENEFSYSDFHGRVFFP